jgi:hypothetical protein
MLDDEYRSEAERFNDECWILDVGAKRRGEAGHGRGMMEEDVFAAT